MKPALSYIKYFSSTSQSDYLRYDKPDNNPAARPTKIRTTHIILKLLFRSLFHHKRHTVRLLHATYPSYNLRLA